MGDEKMLKAVDILNIGLIKEKAKETHKTN